MAKRAPKYDARAELTKILAVLERPPPPGERPPALVDALKATKACRATVFAWCKDHPDLGEKIIAARKEQATRRKIDTVLAVQPSQPKPRPKPAGVSEAEHVSVQHRRLMGFELKDDYVTYIRNNPDFMRVLQTTPGQVLEENQAIRERYFDTDEETGKLTWVGDAKDLAAYVKAREEPRKWLETVSKFLPAESHSVTEATIKTDKKTPLEEMSTDELLERLEEQGVTVTDRTVVLDTYARDLN